MLICLGCVAVSPVDKVYANCLSLRTTLFIFFPPHLPLTYKNKTTRQFMRRSCAEATARPDRKISRIDSMMRTHSKPAGRMWVPDTKVIPLTLKYLPVLVLGSWCFFTTQKKSWADSPPCFLSIKTEHAEKVFQTLPSLILWAAP